MQIPIRNSGSLIILSLLLLIFITFGCSLPPQSRQLLRQPDNSKYRKSELTEVPFFAQDKYQCGPAALSTMLADNGIAVKPEQLANKVYLPNRKGSIQIEMIAASRSFGMLTYQIKPNLDALINQIQSGYPVLVLQNLALSWHPQWHYAVVVGYDLDKEVFILRSGTQKRKLTAIGTFERTWARSDYWGIVIIPPDKIPADVEYLKYLNTIQQFEATGQFKMATEAYYQAHLLWPQEELPLMGLGNSSYSLGDYTRSAKAFKKATLINPNSGQAWNNLAYALKALNCLNEAITSIKKALSISANNKTFQNSYQEILKFEKDEEKRNTLCRITEKPI